MRKSAVLLPLAALMATVCLSLAVPASAAPTEGALPTLVAAKDDDPGKAEGHDKQKERPKKENPGKGHGSQGGNPPSHSNGKGRDQAPGQVRKSPGTSAEGGASNANPRSENENEKITYCHVPPGNPANGHAITTSVNAIDPGHLNHPDDVIPPFEFVKHGETVSFAGLNWGPDAQAYVDAGCTTSATTSEGTLSASPTTPVTGETASPDLDTTAVSEVAGASEESFVDGILPDAGGARLGLLLAALALIGVGTALVLRRRRAA